MHERLATLCRDIPPAAGMPAFEAALRKVLPEQDFRWVLTRGHWHRLGGVVDSQRQRVSEHLGQWAEAESNGDVDELLAKYSDTGYFATHLAGRTHYLTAPAGDSAQDFLQLEIEELQEVIARPLIDPDHLPDSLEEFIEPLDAPHLNPEPVAPAYYQLRRITSIAQMMAEQPQNLPNLRRFFQDWHDSSAHKSGHFCRHWALELREYMDRDGERRLNAKPVPTFAGTLPEIPAPETLHGAELANAIHAYDRQLGYPFAWYFILLTRKAANYALAEAVLRDQSGEYDYLPARDLRVLQMWARKPYGV